MSTNDSSKEMNDLGYKQPGNRRNDYGPCPFCNKRGLYLQGPRNWQMTEPKISCKYCGQHEQVPDVWTEPDLTPPEREMLALNRLHERAAKYG